MRRWLIMFFALGLTHALAQTPQIDSLRQLLSDSKSEEQVDILNELSSEINHYDAVAARNYAEQALDLSRSLQYLDGERGALLWLGLCEYNNANFSSALKYHFEGLRLATKDDDLKAYQLVMAGNVYQATADYDSAEYYYRTAVNIENKLNSEKYLAYAYRNFARLYVTQWKNDSAVILFEKALQIYDRRNSVLSKAETWFALVEVHRNLGNYIKAYELIQNGCGVANNNEDRFLKLYCALTQGENHYNTGAYTEALKNLLEALALMEGIDMPLQLTRLYMDLGDVYDALGQNQVGMKYYLEALKLAEKAGIKYQLTKVQSNLAWMYKNQRNFKLAHEYIGHSLELNRSIGNDHGIAYNYNIKGVIFLDQENYDSATYYLTRSLQIRERIGDRIGISTCKYNLALVLESKNRFQEAVKLQFEALQIDEQVGNRFTMGTSYNSLGSLFTKLKKNAEALQYLKKAEEIGKQTGSVILQMNNAYFWSEYYKARGDFRQALNHHETYTALNDSLYSEVSAAKLAEMQALYQVESKDNQIKLLNQERALQENQIQLQKSRINMQTIIIASIVLGLILISMLALKTWQYNKQITRANIQITEKQEEIQSQSEELIEANATIANINKDLEEKIQNRTLALTRAYKELDTFFYRSSHDFRRPLTTFLGLAEVANVTVKDPNALELFEKVRETAINLDKMLVKLQSISDVGSQQLVLKEVFLKEIFDGVCNDFREELQRKSMRASIDIALTKPLVSYPALLKTIIENLVENAIDFCTPDQPYLRVTVEEKSEFVVLKFQDNGYGIHRDYHDQIFEMYFRGSERSKGNGLGLYIVKKAVEKLDGTVSVTSTAGHGSIFIVEIRNHYQA